MNFNFVFVGGGTPDALTGKLRFFQPGNFEMISHFLRFLARSLYFFCEPEERLQRQIYLLEREQGAEVRRLQQKHSDFWQRWQEDPTYPSRLATSRERILGQTCSVEQLREYYLKLFEEEIELLHRRYRLYRHSLELRQAELAHRRQLLSRLSTSRWYFKIRGTWSLATIHFGLLACGTRSTYLASGWAGHLAMSHFKVP